MTHVNTNHSHDIVELLSNVDIEDIKKAIKNYSTASEFNDFPIGSFSNFMTIKQIDMWCNDSSVPDAKKRQSVNKKNNNNRKFTKEELAKYEEDSF